MVRQHAFLSRGLVSGYAPDFLCAIVHHSHGLQASQTQMLVVALHGARCAVRDAPVRIPPPNLGLKKRLASGGASMTLAVAQLNSMFDAITTDSAVMVP